MQNDLKKKKLILIVSTISSLVVLGYLGYVVMGKVASSKIRYIEKYKEVIVSEKKQEQADSLQEELAKTVSERKEIREALLGQSDDEKLKLVIQFENIAKSIGLSYEWEIIRTLTNQSIAEEEGRLAQARRRSRGGESGEEKFPSIVFSIKLEGGYSGIISFLERLQALPYYINIDRLDALNKGYAAEATSPTVSATMQITVFTK